MLFLVIGFVNSLDRESVTVIDSETNTEKPIKGMQELEKSISLETYDSYEILGDSVNIKKDIISHRALGTNLSLSRTVFSTFKIYDFKTYKNGELDYELPYIFFEEDKEAIVLNISSRSGITAQEGQNVYTAAKWGVTGFSESLKADLKGSKIRVATVFQGGTNTEMFNKVGEHFDQGKLIKPEDLADVIVFMLSRPPQIWLHDVRVEY